MDGLCLQRLRSAGATSVAMEEIVCSLLSFINTYYLTIALVEIYIRTNLRVSYLSWPGLCKAVFFKSTSRFVLHNEQGRTLKFCLGGCKHAPDRL